jgi:hypothetical protein
MTSALGPAVDRLDGRAPAIVSLRAQIRHLVAFRRRRRTGRAHPAAAG